MNDFAEALYNDYFMGEDGGICEKQVFISRCLEVKEEPGVIFGKDRAIILLSTELIREKLIKVLDMRASG